MNLIVDASVALKWFLVGEPKAQQALAIIEGENTLVAPDLLIAEVCNAAWRSTRLGRLSLAQVAEIAVSLPHLFDTLPPGGNRPNGTDALGIGSGLDHAGAAAGLRVGEAWSLHGSDFCGAWFPGGRSGYRP